MKNNETNTKSIKINFQAYGVVDKVNGGIDAGATIAKFTSELNAWQELQSKDNDTLNKQLVSIYGSVAPGTAMKKDELATLMVVNLGGFDTKTFGPLKERALSVIDSNPRCYAQIGSGGGIKYMTDEEFAHYQATEETPVQVAARKKAEKKAEKANA